MSAESTAAPAAKAPTSDTPVVRRYMRQMLDDSLAIVAAHMHSQVRTSREFREQVFRYGNKVKKHNHPPAFFLQAFLAGVWSPIHQMSLSDPEVALRYAGVVDITRHLADIRHESVVLIIDYQPAAGHMIVELFAVLELCRLKGAPREPTGSQTEKEYVDAVVAHSALVDRRLDYSVLNMTSWSLDAQDFLRAELAEVKKARMDLAADYAMSLYQQDIFETALAFNLHKTVAASDAAAAKAAHDSVAPVAEGRAAAADLLATGVPESTAVVAAEEATERARTAAAEAAVGPMLCFAVARGGFQPSIEQLTLAQLDRLATLATTESGLENPMAREYAEARKLMIAPRKRGEAVIILSRFADNVFSSLATVTTHLVPLDAMAPYLERVREERTEADKKARAELEAARAAAAAAKK